MSSEPSASAPRRTIVVIGNFDGVHLGHQAVLAAVSRVARARDLRPTMLTFEPHPAVTLGRRPPPLLTRHARKVEIVERTCPGMQVVVREFTSDFARQSPAEFVERVLVDELRAAVVMVGTNFRFGHQRSGSFADLERFGAQWGFEAIAEPLVSDSQGPWASTRIRSLIDAGDVEAAQSMLGRPHMVSGVVVRGDQRGRSIGFPTCNVAELAEAMPPNGVYAVLVDVVDEHDGPRALASGVANIGVRPTVAADSAARLLEVHLFDVDQDLYGAQLRVHLMARLRPERRFPDLEALKRAIVADADNARQALSTWEPDPTADGAWL